MSSFICTGALYSVHRLLGLLQSAAISPPFSPISHLLLSLLPLYRPILSQHCISLALSPPPFSPFLYFYICFTFSLHFSFHFYSFSLSLSLSLALSLSHMFPHTSDGESRGAFSLFLSLVLSLLLSRPLKLTHCYVP